MTGCVYAAMGPTNFVLGVLISEIIARISSVAKEDVLMMRKATRKVMEATRPFRLSLLMSLCNSSEKGAQARRKIPPSPLF